MMGGNEVTYQVTGEKIATRLLERAASADKVVEELLGPDGSDPDSPCEGGIVQAAREDAKRLRLRAEHIDKEATFTVSAGTLQEIFLEQRHYGQKLRDGGPASEAMAERGW